MVARKRSFDEGDVLERAGRLFGDRGYHGTSIDEIVRAVGINRASLYSTFGSKRGLFLAALRRAHDHAPSDPEAQDLLLVALLELAPHDAAARGELRPLVAAAFDADPARLGRRLLARGRVDLPTEGDRP
jgi:AcrR family transcriptional regulator